MRHAVGRGDVVLALDEVGEPHADRPTVLLLPAMGVPLGYYRPLLEAWGARGRHVLGLELRGMPLSRATVPSFGYADLVGDLAAVLSDRLLRSRRVVLVGHSLGGHLALLAAAGRVQPDGIVTIGTGTSSPAGRATALDRVLRRVGIEAVTGVTFAARRWPGHRLGFGGKQPRAMMQDWAYEARHGRYRLREDPTDYEAALGRVRVPVLLLALAGDRLVGPLAVDHLARRLPSHVEQTTVTAPAPLHHVSWARAAPGPVVDAVEHWLAAR